MSFSVQKLDSEMSKLSGHKYTPLNKQSEQQNPCSMLPPEQHAQDQEYNVSMK